MRKNLDPAIWGPGAWDFLHNTVSAVDGASRGSYDRLMGLLPDVLPCASCREHAARYVREHPPDAAQRLDVWLQDFERDIRQRKRGEEARRKRAQQGKGGTPWQLLSIFVLLLIALALTCFAQR